VAHDSDSVRRHAWDAPGAYPTSRAGYSSLEAQFVLHESAAGMVLFPSALELGTSAMEVMAVAAKNAALLVAGKQAQGGKPAQGARGEL
jgi:hypothetical protein